MRSYRALSFAILLTNATAAVGAPQTTVRIFAAASLTDALGEALARYEKSHPGLRIVSQFGASSDLARQIVAGAPAGLFFSADETQMDRVEAAGLLESGFRRDVLSNQLVIVVPGSSAARVASPQDLDRLDRIALADPEAVPAGVYARRYLEKLGLWDRLRPRVVPTLDVRAALSAVASGNTDAGFVYRTDAKLEPRVRVAFEVPSGEGPRISYPLALVRGGGEDARDLFRFLSSSEAREVFELHGFIFPGY